MTKLVFPIRGVGSYRTLGPVIEAALEDLGYDVELLLGPLAPSWRSKSYLNPTPENIPRRLVARGCRATKVHSQRQLIAGMLEADAIVVDLGRAAFVRDVSGGQADPGFHREATWLLRRQMWCAVFDADHSVLPTNHFEDAEMIFWPSPYYLKLAVREGAGTSEKLESRSHYVGYVRADNLKRASPHVTCEEWGIDRGRPVALYIPDAYRLRQERAYISNWYVDVWCVDQRVRRVARALRSRRGPRDVWRALTDRRSHAQMVAQVRAFCDRSGAQLVMVRRRQKEWLGEREFTDEELRAADCIVREQEQYPQTMLRALQLADLAISSYRSGAILDAIAAGVPYITVGLPYYADLPANALYSRRFDEEQGHWPGATWLVGAGEFIRSFAHRTLSDFTIDHGVLQAIRAKYTGPVDGRCSERILGAIRDQLAGRPASAAGQSRVGPV